MRALDLSFQEATVTAILGRSGCGKTTLLRLATGLISPTGGSIRLQGQPVSRPRTDVSILPQDFERSLLAWRTVRENVAIAIEGDRSTSSQQRASRVQSALDTVGLAAVAERYPGSLSGGMQQRCGLARTLAARRRWWFLDEPFGALDMLTKLRIQVEVLALWRSIKPAPGVLLVTHDPDEALLLSDRVVVISPPPARVVLDLTISLPHPRDPRSTRALPEYMQLWSQIYDSVSNEERA